MLDSDNVWFVTGCSSGLGKSLASTIHAAGHRLVATARKIDTLAYFPDSPNVLKLSLDVTSAENINHCFTTAVAEYGRIDIVIKNAGYALSGDTEAIAESDAPSSGVQSISPEKLSVFSEKLTPQDRVELLFRSLLLAVMLRSPEAPFTMLGFTQSFAKELEPSWNIKMMVAAPGGIRTNYFTNTQIGARHPAYASPNSPFNQLLGFMMNPDIQETFAEPDDLAKVLFDVVVGQDQRKLPARLLMGAETLPLFESEYKKDANEIEAWKAETIRCTSKEGVTDIPI